MTRQRLGIAVVSFAVGILGWSDRACAWMFPRVRITGPATVCAPATITYSLVIEGGFDCTSSGYWISGPTATISQPGGTCSVLALIDTICNEECPFEDTGYAYGGTAGVGVAHETNLHAPDGTSDLRTTVGIGEWIAMRTIPYGMDADWSVLGTPVAGYKQWEKFYYALNLVTPTSPGGQLVQAKFGSGPDAAICSVSFSVIIPTDTVYSNPVGLLQGMSGLLYMGQSTQYDCKFLPRSVSFREGLFVEWNPGSLVNYRVWPDGTYEASSEKFACDPYRPITAEEVFWDHDQRIDVPMQRLLAGAGFVDFSYTVHIDEQYLNHEGDWISFLVTDHVEQWCGLPSSFGGELGQARAVVHGVAGPWMGPWLQPFGF